jgi:hypothetical protein
MDHGLPRRFDADEAFGDTARNLEVWREGRGFIGNFSDEIVAVIVPLNCRQRNQKISVESR